MMWLLCSVLAVLPAFAHASKTGGQEYTMTTYFLVLLKMAPSAPAASAADAAANQKAHVAYLQALAEQGPLMAAGPLEDKGEIGGIVILKTDSLEQAKTLADADPGVKAGRFVTEVVPFMAPEGWFGKPSSPPQPDRLFFGFLVNGPNRAQDAATATQLQQEHLAYMDKQAAAGRLVLAGPIATREGTRRGVIAYRAASLEEAVAFASGDPMVKAGRLAVELHPWMTTKGVLR
jgi:uncharacterized protein YciI